jgi:hypothetical protein
MVKRRDVTSREYKVMLSPSRLDGDEATMTAQVQAFWAEFKAALAPLDIPTTGSFSGVKARRLIRFFDTDAHSLHSDSYIVREREDIETGSGR